MTSGSCRYHLLTILILLQFTLIPLVAAQTRITVVVNPGNLGSIETAAQGEKQVDWWDADKSDDSACTDCFAAIELRRFLQQAKWNQETQIDLIPVSQGVPKEGAVILIGNSTSNPSMSQFKAGDATDPAKAANEEGYRIRSLVDGDRQITLIEGNDRIGSLYGVYDYLEHLGFRFFGLGEQGTVIPAEPVNLPENLDIQSAPAFQSRGFWAWEDRGEEPFLLWMARNRMNYWTAAQSNPHFCKKVGLKLVLGGHSAYKFFLDPEGVYPFNHPLIEGDESKPADPYVAPPTNEFKGDQDGDGKLTTFEAHPEWYGLSKGARQRKMDDEFGDCNICTSNKDGVDFLARNFVQSLIDGKWKYVDIVNFWALDASPWCECENCKKLGSETNRLLLMVHQVQKVMKEAQDAGRLKRKVLLHTCAYHETLNPPDRPLPADFDYDTIAVTLYPIGRTYSHSFADPASTEINQPMAQDFLEWSQGGFYQGSVCIGEYYDVSGLRILPVVYTHIMATDIPWFYRYGVRHFQYMHTPTKNWGTWTLNQRLMAQLLWNPAVDTTALLADYYEKFYPTTAPSTRSFYEHLEKAFSNIKAIKHYVEAPDSPQKAYALASSLRSMNPNLFPLKTLQYEESHPVTDDGLDLIECLDEAERARQSLDSSLIHCTDGIERQRLLEAEMRFAYGEATLNLFNHLVRASIFHHQKLPELARLEVAKAGRHVENLRNMVEVVQGAGAHASDVNGYEATQLKAAYEFLFKEYGDTDSQKAE